jgi:hypothetical protein
MDASGGRSGPFLPRWRSSIKLLPCFIETFLYNLPDFLWARKFKLFAAAGHGLGIAPGQPMLFNRQNEQGAPAGI